MNNEENSVVVIDNGSSAIKSGFAGDDNPLNIFPTLVGRSKSRIQFSHQNNTTEYYINDSLNTKTNFFDEISPIQNGQVKDFDALSALWKYIFEEKLRIDSSEKHMLLTEDFELSYSVREKMSEIMFESFKVPSLYICRPSVLPIYSAGTTTGLVVESGESTFRLEFMYDGFSYQNSTFHNSLTGGCVTETLRRLLTKKFNTSTLNFNRETLQEIKENLCSCTTDFATKRTQKSSELEKEFELPDGTILRLGIVRFEVAEALFEPQKYDIDCEGIQHYIANSIQKCDLNSRKYFLSNIILAGGNTMFDGIDKRLQHEINKLVAKNAKVKIITLPERKLSAWIGGSILGSLNSFEQALVSREKYMEYGSSLIHLNCQL
ncbi:actin, putative [Entamoeba invadens IP1]|uniref:Actin, putative n=1 Tax=Entamoeba invadens IP1 TaxID=370355 RepID=L7FJ78_ENTIV|nr:actin, putative [Entamoeba invadens IP1]ELP83565.1 actin, putative [Entamoeba invadens IP1]|eukprot:XP_004182911.1 actin, putative [Entamoeba invadens IP1]